MTDITLFVGSVSGGALATAKAVAQTLEELGCSARVIEAPEVEDLTADDSAILVCTSTTGQGELPPNLLPFYLNLREKLPVQQNRPFGVIVLGDSAYRETFCGAGQLIEEVFFELGCRKVGETLCIDASETLQPETRAIPWARAWLRALEPD